MPTPAPVPRPGASLVEATERELDALYSATVEAEHVILTVNGVSNFLRVAIDGGFADMGDAAAVFELISLATDPAPSLSAERATRAADDLRRRQPQHAGGQAMKISPRQLKPIHVARRRIGLSEAGFRTALVRLGGVESSRDLDREGFDLMMALFEHLGFAPWKPQGKDFGARPGMASFAQLQLIRALWREYTLRAYAGDAELEKWLAGTFKVSTLRFLDAATARKAITALLDMRERQKAGGKTSAA